MMLRIERKHEQGEHKIEMTTAQFKDDWKEFSLEFPVTELEMIIKELQSLVDDPTITKRQSYF